MRRILYNIAIISLFLLGTSCEKRAWDNPFDPDYPKSEWTPSDFKVWQGPKELLPTYDNYINLSWYWSFARTLPSPDNRKIDGFIVKRSIGNNYISEVGFVDYVKGSYVFTDSNITVGGEIYKYIIQAKAGDNLSLTNYPGLIIYCKY